MGSEALVFHFVRDDVLQAPSRCGLLAVPDFIQRVDSWCQGFARFSRSRSRDDPQTLVIDLSQVTDWDMSVFKSLVWARRRCVAAGGDVILVVPPGQLFTAAEEVIVRDLFEVTDRSPHDRGASLDSRPASRPAHPVGGLELHATPAT